MAPPRHAHASSRLPLLLLLAACALLCRAGAVEYVVGDGDLGWDSGINYAAWTRKHTFAVGDVLVFQYVSSQHNVYEVRESTYRSCDAAGDKGVLAKYTSGYDKVVLAEPRSYWFICEVPGHCPGGMKMKLTVNVSDALPPNAVAVDEPPAPSGSAVAAGGCCRRCWFTMGLLAIGLMNYYWVIIT